MNALPQRVNTPDDYESVEPDCLNFISPPSAPTLTVKGSPSLDNCGAQPNLSSDVEDADDQS